MTTLLTGNHLERWAIYETEITAGLFQYYFVHQYKTELSTETKLLKKQACIFLFERLIKPSFLEAICCCSRDKKNKYDFSGNEKPFQLCWEHSKKRKETAVFFLFIVKLMKSTL